MSTPTTDPPPSGTATDTSQVTAERAEAAPHDSRGWGVSLAAILFGQFFSVMGYSMVVPFLPIFVQDLGVRDLTEVAFWSGAIVGIAPLASAVSQPISGALADRFGLRAMVIRAHLLGAIITGLTSLVPNVGMLLVMRALSGGLGTSSGTNSALAATAAPPGRMSFSLGMVQMAMFVGSSVGPIFGGLLADRVGVRGTFLVTSACLGVAAVLVTLLVKVGARPLAKKAGPSTVANLTSLLTLPALLAVAAVSFFVQLTNGSIQPTMTLYVQHLEGVDSVGVTVGLVFGLSALSSALSAVVLGRIGDQIGQRVTLIVALAGAGVLLVPQAMAADSNQLLISRFLMGLFIGGAIPSVNTIAARVGGVERRAAAISLTHSASLVGLAGGPYFGAALAAGIGLAAPFWAAAVILLLGSVWVTFAVKQR